MTRTWCALILAVLATGAAGCGMFGDNSSSRAGSSSESPDLDPALPAAEPSPPIPDVPVPSNFHLDDASSRNYAVPGGRFVDHTYYGWGDKFTIKRFFERYMLANRWIMTSFTFTEGRIVLDFEKDNERCRITIRRTGFLHQIATSVFVGPVRLASAKADPARG